MGVIISIGSIRDPEQKEVGARLLKAGEEAALEEVLGRLKDKQEVKMTGEYESRENLSKETLDLEMARQSLIEELEAINWYQERIEVTKNDDLRKILEHNRDEEKEHVAMLIEWIRKNDPTQDRMFEGHD